MQVPEENVSHANHEEEFVPDQEVAAANTGGSTSGLGQAFVQGLPRESAQLGRASESGQVLIQGLPRESALNSGQRTTSSTFEQANRVQSSVPQSMCDTQAARAADSETAGSSASGLRQEETASLPGSSVPPTEMITRLRTRLQDGIRKEKKFIDETIWYGCLATREVHSGIKIGRLPWMMSLMC
jgi:hypothetical protein